MVFRVVSPSLVVGTEGMAAYTTMPGGLVDSWHRCSRSHRDSDASNSWGHISAPSRPLVLVLGFPSFRCSLKFRSCYWLLSSSSMVGYIGDTAQFHQNFFFVKRYMQGDLNPNSDRRILLRRHRNCYPASQCRGQRGTLRRSGTRDLSPIYPQ